jgi:hypothetical protein
MGKGTTTNAMNLIKNKLTDLKIAKTRLEIKLKLAYSYKSTIRKSSTSG